MSLNIYKHEFRMRLRSVITWSLSAAAIALVFFAIYPIFADEATMMTELLKNYPPQMRAAFGLDNADLTTILGFYSFVLLFIQICLAIQAGNYGFGLVSVEEAELTADFLLTKPVGRSRILTSKLLAALSSLFVTDLVIWGSSFLAIELFRGGREYDAGLLILLLVSLMIFQLFFLCVGLVVSLLVRRIRSVTPYSLGLGFGSYVLAAFSAVFGDVKLEYITPFKHFDLTYIVKHEALNTPLVLLNVSLTLLSLVLSYWLYSRRDIPSVS